MTGPCIIFRSHVGARQGLAPDRGCLEVGSHYPSSSQAILVEAERDELTLIVISASSYAVMPPRPPTALWDVDSLQLPDCTDRARPP